MNALVVYDSQYGNTEKIAQAIAEALRASGQARSARVNTVDKDALKGVDALFVGSPTQAWRPTAAMRSWLQAADSDQLRALTLACFDTRFKKSHWLTGSAASTMAKSLRTRGAAPVVPPESFFVAGTEGPLLSGEIERAGAWARAVAAAARVPVAQR